MEKYVKNDVSQTEIQPTLSKPIDASKKIHPPVIVVSDPKFLELKHVNSFFKPILSDREKQLIIQHKLNEERRRAMPMMPSFF